MLLTYYLYNVQIYQLLVKYIVQRGLKSNFVRRKHFYRIHLAATTVRYLKNKWSTF